MDWYAGVLILCMRFVALSSLRLRPFNSFTNVRYEPVASYSTNRQLFLPNPQVTSRFPFLSGEHLSKTFRFTGYPGFETPVLPLKPMTVAASSFDVSLPSLNQPEVYIDKSKLPRRNKPNFFTGQLKDQRGSKNNIPPRKQDLRGVTLDIRGGGYKIEPPRNSRPYKPPSVGDTKHEIRNRRKNNGNNVGRESNPRPRSRRPANKPPRSGAPSPNQLYQTMPYEQALKYISPNVEIESPENVLPYNPKLFKQMQQMMKQSNSGQTGNNRDVYLPFNSGGNLRLPTGNIPDSYKSSVAMQHLPGRTTTEVITPQQYSGVGNSFSSFSPQQLFAQFNTPDKASNLQASNTFFSQDPNAQVSTGNLQIDQNTYQQLQQTFQQGQVQTPNLNSMAQFFYQQENAKTPSADNFNFQATNGQTNGQPSFADTNAYLQAFYANTAASLPTFPGFSSDTTNAEHTNQEINAQTSQQPSTDKHNFPASSMSGFFQDQPQLEQQNAYLAMQQANAQQQLNQPLEEGKISAKFVEAVRNLPSQPQNPGAISLQTPITYEYTKEIHPQYSNIEYLAYAGNPGAYGQSDGESVYGNTGQTPQQTKSQLNEDTEQENVKLYPQTSSHSQGQLPYLSSESLYPKTTVVSDPSPQAFTANDANSAGQNSESLLKQLKFSSAQLTPEKLYYQQAGNAQGSSKFEFSTMDAPSPPVFSRPTAYRNQNPANKGKAEATEANRKEVGDRAALHLSEQMSVFVSENPPVREFYLKPEEYEIANIEMSDAYEKAAKPETTTDEIKPKDRKSSSLNSEKVTQVSYGGHGKDLLSFEISPGSKTTDPFEEPLQPEFVTRNATSETSYQYYKTRYHDPVPASTSAPVEIRKSTHRMTTSVSTVKPINTTPTTTAKVDYSETPICALHSNTTYCLQDPEYPKNQIKQAIQKNRHPLDRFLLMDSMIGQSNIDQLDENVLKSASKSVSYSFEGNLVAPTPEAANNTGSGCDSNTYFAKPLRAINTAGQWKIIVNVEFGDAESNYTQTVRIEECSRKGGFLGTCGGETISACLQQYKLYRLLVWEPNKNFYIDAFLLPISCFCGSKHTSER